MAALSDVFGLLCTLLLLSRSTIRGQEEGRMVHVEWRADAVRNYTPETPLQVYPGDKLLFICPNGSNSNAWYQLDVAQYLNCSCVTGSFCQKIGECTSSSPTPRTLIQEISANSAPIGSAVVYEAGRKYYFTSYSPGGPNGAFSDNKWGGECISEELRMVIEVVGEATTDPTTGSPPPTSVPSSTTGGPGNVGNTGGDGDTGGGTENTGGDTGNTGGIDDGGDTGNTNNTGGIADSVQTTPGGGTESASGDQIEPNSAGLSGGNMNSCSRFIMYSSVVLCACLAILLRH